MRVTRSRELVAEGHSPSVVARVAQISRQAIYRVPKPRPLAVRRSGPPADEIEAAIVEVAQANQTDGYRMVTALVMRKLGRAVNRKRVLRVMRERRLIQRRRRLDRRRRPGFFRVTGPNELWHLDMTSVWVAEHGWCYLMAAIDCCTREIVGWHLELRCRAKESIALVEQAAANARHHARDADAGHRQRLGVHRPRLQARPLRPGHRPPPRRLPRPREPGVHRVLVLQAQGTLRLAARVRDPRPGAGGDRRPHRQLPPPPPLGAELPDPSRGRPDLGRCPRRPTNPRGLNRQPRAGSRPHRGWNSSTLTRFRARLLLHGREAGA